VEESSDGESIKWPGLEVDVSAWMHAIDRSGRLKIRLVDASVTCFVRQNRATKRHNRLNQTPLKNESNDFYVRRNPYMYCGALFFFQRQHAGGARHGGGGGSSLAAARRQRR
jgi:hypothetical protein